MFPSREALNEKAYIDGIGLNENEFNWLKTTDPNQRFVMIKTARGSSTIVNTNLEFLGNHLKIYNSNAQNVNQLKELIEKYPDSFREKYLFETQAA